MSDLECPYCDEDLADPDDCYKEDEIYEGYCPYCEKHFVFTLSYSVHYSSDKADCLNGGEHDWKQRSGHPEEYFANRQKCSMCDRERTIKPTEPAKP